MSVMLCTLNELKTMLRIPTAESSLDTSLTTCIYSASQRAQRVTDRIFTYTVYSNQAYKGGGESIALRQWPVDPLATLQVKDYDATGALVIFDTSDYAVDYDYGIVRLRGGLRFTHGPDSAQVSYAAGFASTGTGNDTKIGVYDDLSRDVCEFAKVLYQAQNGIMDAIKADDAKALLEKQFGNYARVW